MGCGERAVGASIKDIPLDFTQGASSPGSTSMRVTRIKDKPKGVTRYLEYIDFLLTLDLTTAAGGSVLPRRNFNFVSNIVMGSLAGSVYSNVSARQVRQLYRNLAGKRAAADPANQAGGAANVLKRMVLRIPFADPSTNPGDDRALPSDILHDDISLTFAASDAIDDDGVAADVTVNTATTLLRATARVHDTSEEGFHRPWQVQSIPFSTVDVTLMAGDYRTAFFDNATESWTEALLSELFISSYSKFPIHHQSTAARWNAETAASAADELTPNAMDHYPFLQTPGYVGRVSEHDSHGGEGAVHARITGGSTTSGTVVALWSSPTTAEQKAEVGRMAYGRDISPGGEYAVMDKARNGYLPLDDRKALAHRWVILPKADAEKAVAIKKALSHK